MTKNKTPQQIAEDEREMAKRKAMIIFKIDVFMQIAFKIILPALIFILNFSLFLITTLNPSVLKIIAVAIFFILSIAFIISIKPLGVKCE